ncbi:hypothetical protein [Aureivirga sp. CE67]|uniref:hypothetical protein n=1 Tax=Aureivirga sp. CE67 TaxID=1788983 RepID=UPI0018C90940|nr:hypothetical protein [Aureivirga sp. CE67]
MQKILENTRIKQLFLIGSLLLLTNCNEEVPPPPEEDKSDYHNVNRFIAHAGGMIDGHLYTNSLEALNYSYEKGFKLFEIDFLKTSDDKIVAAHDWDSWKEKTGFTGDIPPTLEQFQSELIFDKYTPMNMQDVNKWFEEHSDAILVTDKINSPKEFTSKFIDNSRLKMELFTEEAIEEAIQIDPKIVMISQSAIYDIGFGNILEYVQEHKIETIAISRKKVLKKAKYLLELKKEGVRTYVYHVNSEGKNEKYVFENEFPYVYGMYADSWDFKK